MSVIIPVYNSGQLVAGALESLRAQTFDNWEALLVDDCSTDDSVILVRELLEQLNDTRIRLFELPENGGPSAARNHGVREAGGEFVCFLDADDTFLPAALTHLVGLTAGVDVVCAAHVARSASGVETVRPDRLSGTVPGMDALTGLLEERVWNFNHGRLYRRDLLETVRHDERVRRYEDLIFNAAAFSRAGAVRFTSQPVYVYNVNPASATWSQKHSSRFVTETEAFLREGLSPETERLVPRRAWNTMRTTLAVVVYSGALMAHADQPTLKTLRKVLSDALGPRAFFDVLRTRPQIAIAGQFARLLPGPYAKMYREYVGKTYEIAE
ncbi:MULTISPECIES: glycosyltransferase family 2 protein [Arthrobacter]|uniref:Glycosyltransferase family 2 protein n=2 Tax=Arthrobacter TaxID=1663 RepID=A0ABU9KJS7_9MICC|nr:glycosyltransferase family 2 protein [Arthrobacter sp. YJM1]MDP5227255.1 glycosyltransferase family 2 protein [Arthrobacter sp. YJM1]